VRCEDFQSQLLSGESTAELQAHLATCEMCQAVQPRLVGGASLLEDEAMWLAPGDELENSIVDMLVSDGAAGSDEAIPTVDDDLPPSLHAVEDIAAPMTPARRTPNVWALLGVAAAVVVALLFVTSTRSAPDWSVDVAGGPDAPQASAVVDGWNTDSGTRLVVEARGLEPAPDGFFYELWLSDGPLHISGGTFTGLDDVELWAAVSRGDFPRIWITLEPIDEDESPSSVVVLDTGKQS